MEQSVCISEGPYYRGFLYREYIGHSLQGPRELSIMEECGNRVRVFVR